MPVTGKRKTFVTANVAAPIETHYFKEVELSQLFSLI